MRRRTIRRRSRSGRQQLRARAAERVGAGVCMRAGDAGGDATDGHVRAARGRTRTAGDARETDGSFVGQFSCEFRATWTIGLITVPHHRHDLQRASTRRAHEKINGGPGNGSHAGRVCDGTK